MSDAPTLAGQLLRHAETRPGETSFVFRTDQDETRTFEDLARRAAGWAYVLREQDVAGERVLIVLPSGLAFIEVLFGAFLAGAVAVPSSVPRPGRSFDRLEGILRDCSPKVVVAETATLDALRALPAVGDGVRFIDAGEPPSGGTELRDDSVPDATALLQYTSGSIGEPKGVMLSHANLMAQESAIRENFGHGEETIVAAWLPMHHDMGLIGNVMQPLYLGRPCWLTTPEAFLRRPARWMKLISDARATTSGGPNFAYDLCATRVRDKELEGVDLSTLTVLYNGAEPVRAETLARFAKRYGPLGLKPNALHPCYGLAEASLLVTGKPAKEKVVIRRLAGEDKPRVGCGAPPAGTEAKIVDPETRTPCGDGGTGEVWVRGPSVGAGYWPGDSRGVFGEEAESLGGGWMRTGDMGLIDKGDLFVTGRLRAMVIVAGQNHHAEDIEHLAQESLGVQKCPAAAAFAVESEGTEALVLALETRAAPEDHDAMRERVAEELTRRLDIGPSDIRFVPPGKLPRTTSGKIRRRECADRYLSEEPPFRAP